MTVQDGKCTEVCIKSNDLWQNVVDLGYYS